MTLLLLNEWLIQKRLRITGNERTGYRFFIRQQTEISRLREFIYTENGNFRTDKPSLLHEELSTECSPAA